MVRRSIAAAFAISAALLTQAPALAADYPVLRGSQIEDGPPPPSFHEPSTSWTGFYVGGLAGYGDTNLKPGNGPRQLIANYLRGTAIEAEMQASTLLNLPDVSRRKAVFGGFVGYNMQIGDVVLGLEGDYSRLDVSAESSDAITRFQALSDGYTGTAALSGSVTARAEQLGTLRIRAGYVMGSFMPFVTGGVAYGTGRVTGTATVRTAYVDSDPTNGVLPSISNPAVGLVADRKNASMVGGVVGAGVDALFGALLLRGEVLYHRFEAQGGIKVEHTTARVGAGVKF